MFSFRPTLSQYKKLKEGKAPIALVIHSAVVRWRSGRIVLGTVQKEENECFSTQNIVVWKNYPDVRDGDHMRQILEAHLTQPDQKIAAELQSATKEVEDCMSLYQSKQYIEEKEDGKEKPTRSKNK